MRTVPAVRSAAAYAGSERGPAEHGADALLPRGPAAQNRISTPSRISLPPRIDSGRPWFDP